MVCGRHAILIERPLALLDGLCPPAPSTEEIERLDWEALTPLVPAT
jgi:hypothetical protein